MNILADDELGLILSRVTDPADRKSTSQVCKGWWVMEALTRSSLRVLDVNHLPRLLARYPNLVRFETPRRMTNADLTLVARSCPKLEAIVLDQTNISKEIEPQRIYAMLRDEFMDNLRIIQQVGDEGLFALANGCPKLSKIVLNWRTVGMVGLVSLITSAGLNLTYLDLDNSSSVTDQALEAVRSSSCPISVLNLGGSFITDAGLRFLANGSCSKTIKQLKVAGCRGITSAGLSHLHKMCGLEELDLGYCRILPDVGAEALSAIRTLKKLNLAGQRFEEEQPMIAMAKNCINLEVLDLCYSEVTRDDLRTLFGHKCLQSLILVGCWSDDITGSDVEDLALNCPSFKSILMEDSDRDRILQETQETTMSRFVQFIDPYIDDYVV